MKVIQTRLMPKRWAMSFVGIIWTGDRSWIDAYVQNHETIHLQQQKEMLFLPFYIEYVLEWLAKSLYYRSFRKGYLNICHEREAYTHEKELNYLKTRKPFNQFKWMA